MGMNFTTHERPNKQTKPTKSNHKLESFRSTNKKKAKKTRNVCHHKKTHSKDQIKVKLNIHKNKKQEKENIFAPVKS